MYIYVEIKHWTDHLEGRINVQVGHETQEHVLNKTKQKYTRTCPIL